MKNILNDRIFYVEGVGFMTKELHGDDIPDTAVEVSKKQHAYLVERANNEDVSLYADNGEVKIKTREQSSEEASNIVRQKRNVILRDSDWSQLPDISEEIQMKYRKYRKELRDLPEQEEFPFYIQWPTLED